MEKPVYVLENRIKRLEAMIGILQTVGCTADAPLQARLAEIERLYGQHSVHIPCDALKVLRGAFYNHILRNKRDQTWYAKRREELQIRIQESYDENRQIFGAAKIIAAMKEEGHRKNVECRI